MKPERAELTYCRATCNNREYLILKIAKVFQIRRRDDPVLRCGSLVGAVSNADQAASLILADSHGSAVEIGPWHERVEMDAVPQPPRVPTPRKRRSTS